MTQAAYDPVPGDTSFQAGQTDTSQFYNGQPDATKDTGQSLGVYTPDSSTNSVHSLHGYPENHENYTVAGTGDGAEMNTDQAGYTQDMSGQTALDNSYSQVENTDPVHNTSVMESPTSIGSVEIPQAYTDQSCSQTPMSRSVHPAAISNNSPSNNGLHPAAIQGNSPGNPPTSNQSPHNSSINQSPSAAIHNTITNQSPHHAQQATPISQSPHPIQSPHPPMQPSPHNQQSSPHPPIINSQITSPYTNLPHQSPTGSVAGYAAPPQPQRQSSSSGHSSTKSPRAPSSRSSQQQQQQQLSAQQQAQALRSMHQQAAQYYAAQHQYGAVVAEQQASLAGKQHRSHEAAAAYPLFGSGMFPATTNAGRSSHTGHMDATQAQAAVAQFYSPQQPGVAVPSHGHTSSQASSLVRLQQLTQGLDLLGQPVPQSHVPHASPPPTQKQSKSSKNRAVAPAPPTSHLTLPPAYTMGHYPTQQVGQRVASASAPTQARAPNVTINPSHSSLIQQQYAIQQYNAYNAAMLNPALMYGQQYDPNRSVPQMTYPGYGAPYNINYR